MSGWVAKRRLSLAMFTHWSPIRSRCRFTWIIGQHESQVDGDGRLAGEQRLDAVLDLEVDAVDGVIAGDHLVGGIRIGGDQRFERAVK